MMRRARREAPRTRRLATYNGGTPTSAKGLKYAKKVMDRYAKQVMNRQQRIRGLIA